MTKWLLLAVGLAAATVLPPAVAQTVDGPSVTWRVGAWGKPRAATAGLEAIRSHVEQRTGGKFKMQIGYESYGGPKELLDLLSVGSIDASQVCPYLHPDKAPAYSVLDLPFLPISDAETQRKVHEAVHQHPVIRRELAGWNALPFMSSILPQYEFMGRGKAPKSLDDWRGMRVRATGGLGDAMKRLGAVPTSLDVTEAYNALERGVFDAIALPSTYTHGSNRLHEVSNWLTTNLSTGAQACPYFIGIKAWEKLPDPYKQLVEEAKPIAYEALKAGYKEADDRYFPVFQKRGIELIRYSDADIDRFRAIAAQPVWDEWVQKREAQGVPARELLDFVLEEARAASKS